MSVNGKLVARNLKELERLLERTESRLHIPLGEVLLRQGSITQEQLDLVLHIQNKEQQPFGKLLEEIDSVPRSTIEQALIQKLAIPYIKLSEYKFTPHIAALIPISIIREHKILPLFYANNTIWVATNHPLDPELIKEIRQHTSHRIRDVIISDYLLNQHIEKLIKAHEKLAMDRIRLLCSIGLNSHQVIPTVIRELHHLVPSCCITFYWFDGSHQVVNTYIDSPTCYKTLPLTNTTQHSGTRKQQCSLEKKCQQKSLKQCKFSIPQLDNNICYSHIKYQGKQVGLIEFHRRKNAPKFSLHEMSLIEELSPILSLALKNCSQWNSHFMEVSHSGNLVIDINGKIEFACYRGKKLLHYATQPHEINTTKPAFVPKEIINYCQTLELDPLGNINLPSTPPLHRENHWGTFKFQVKPIQYSKKLGENLFDINIQHILPASLAFFSDWDKWEIPPKQTDVCLLWICGLTHSDIANKLEIKTSTVIDHIRKIYQQFNVHSQAELLSKMRMLSSEAV